MSYKNTNVYTKQGGDQMIVTSSGNITIESSGTAVGSLCVPVQTLAVAQVATNILEFGYTSLVASTTAPTYTLAGPSRAGLLKWIRIESNTSSGTCKVNTSSTGVSVSSSGNQLTFDAVNDAVMLISTSTSAWRIAANTGSAGIAVKST